MLRRRILASAMASVMAIGSVAVVASAEETATAEKQSVTKTELEAYVKEFDKFRENEIYDYGATAGENFLDAIEYCDNVLAQTDATDADYTAAYQMLKAVYSTMKTHSSAELRTLLDNTKSIYDSDNLLNAENADLIYYPDTYEAFVTAYKYADSIIGSSDSRLITDAYNGLYNAYNGLKAYPTITKANFRTALKNYEALFLKRSTYDDWRRGTMSGEYWSEYCQQYWKAAQDSLFTFADIKKIVFDDGAIDTVNYSWGGTESDVQILDMSNGGGTDVEDFITAAYKAFDSEAVGKTTNPYYLNAYQVAIDAVNIFNKFVPDDTNRASKSSVQKLLDKYHNDLVKDYCTTEAQDLWKELTGNTSFNDKDDYTLPRVYSKNVDPDTVAKYKLPAVIAKGTDVRKFVTVDACEYDDDGNKLSGNIPKTAPVYAAVKAAQKYIAGKYEATVWGLDESGEVKTANGSPAEWVIVYRALKYALEDAYPEQTYSTITMKKLTDLIDECYVLCDLTGDSTKFADLEKALVDKRQAAMDWVRLANKDKGYTDNNPYDYAWASGTGDATVSQVYWEVKNAYDALNNEFAKYKYSYGEIANTISDVAEKIDAEELKPTESLLSALDTVAYTLSTITASETDNQVFTGSREFNAYNRLRTKDGSQAEKDFTAAYEKLLNEVEAQKTPDVVKGDLDGDGVPTQKDAAIILQKVAAGETMDLAVADFDGDGYTDQRDAAAILRFVTSQA